MNGISLNIRIGIWLDDLRLGVRGGLSATAPWRLEVLGVDAFGAEVSPRALGQTGRRELGRLLRSKGATVAALRADLGGRRLADARALDTHLQRLKEAVQLCADLGAPRLVVPGGYVPPEGEAGAASVRSAQREAARALGSMAAQSGVRVVWGGGGEPPDVLAAFLNDADSSGLIEVELDPGASVMRDVDPLKVLNALAARVTLARATDHYRGGAEAPFGKGDVRWGEVMVGLSTLQRPQPIDVLAASSVEGDRPALLAAALRRLHALRTNPLG